MRQLFQRNNLDLSVLLSILVIENFVQFKGKGVLIISYETQRRYADMFKPKSKAAATSAPNSNGICDLMICDEAHKLKNAESGLAKALNMLPAKMRVSA